MNSNESREKKNYALGCFVVKGAFLTLSNLKEQGCKSFRVTYKIRRRSDKTEQINYNGYDEAVKGIVKHVEEVGGEAKIADVTVDACEKLVADALQGIVDGFHKMHKQEMKKQFNGEKPKTGLTLRNLVDFVTANRDKFPFGMDTQIACGDINGDSVHDGLGLGTTTFDSDGFKVLFIGYDPNESVF
jgi:hypothetical protein